MSEAEAKLRKLGVVAPGAFTLTDVASAAGGPAAADEDDAKQRVPASWICLRCLPQPLGQNLLRFLQRRGVDVVGVTAYLVVLLIGHLVVFLVLLNLPETLVVRWLRRAFVAASSCFNLSWCGVIYHGPGRVPREDSAGLADQRDPLATQLQPALAAAMGVGRLCNSCPFSAEGSWCQRCSNWKHPLVHHCSKCGQCSIWMDHHCKLCAQCVGFRNFRCFLTWLAYGITVYWCLALLTLHRLYQDGWPQDLWCLRWLPWFGYLVLIASQISSHLQSAALQLAAGFHSRVVRRKFEALFGEATLLQGKLGVLLEGIPREHPDLKKVTHAVDTVSEAVLGLRSGVKMKLEGGNELLWGPFLGKGIDTIAAMYGEPLSWRWFVPMVPGGKGDPFDPALFSKRGCEAWAALEQAMEQGQEVYTQTLQSRREQQQRLGVLLAGIDQQQMPP